MDRRAFIARGVVATGSGALSAVALERLANRAALADMRHHRGRGYGDVARMTDQSGRNILALPAGFSYVTFGDIGSPMSDGNRTPLALDGMAAFRGPHGTVRLIRNHEDRNPPGAGSVPAEGSYDSTAGGGTSTLDYDPRRRKLVRDYVSLAGSHVNCAGGQGLKQRSWLTGEENVFGPDFATANGKFAQRHGYVFEVPVHRHLGDRSPLQPLKAMGRFSHEALATDDRTGIVYETEDPGTGRGAGFYRFLPRDPWNLARGGRLQILGIRGRPQYNAREGQKRGRPLPVKWIDIPEPDPDYVNEDDTRGVFRQGYELGATKFNRLEGCWDDDGRIYFVSTSGGDVKNGDVNTPDGYREGFGQIWEYRPGHHGGDGALILHYESPGGDVLDSPDNLTVTPRGGLIVCEDDASSDSDTDAENAPGIVDVNRLIGITRSGETFVFAVNTFSGSELAGACFSPDGETLFVNVYGDSTGTPELHAGEGMTCAITGPWRRGPL